jgi:hypothetical protein
MVESTKLKYNFGSLGWLTFFGIPVFVIVISSIIAVEILIHSFMLKSILPPESYSIIFLIMGISSYFIQLRKLQFKSTKLTKPVEEFKADVIKILNEDGWEIEFNNLIYLQAIHRKRITSLPLITIRFYKDEIRWNLVYHPEGHNSIGALLSPKTFGKKTLKKIIAST